MMTRKDFIIIQNNMRYTKPQFKEKLLDGPMNQWERDVKQLAHALKLINPSFNSQTFIDACNGIGGSYDTDSEHSISGG